MEQALVLKTRVTLEEALPDPKPLAWSYELATLKLHDGQYGGWKAHLSRDKPNVPEGSIRNLKPLCEQQTAQRKYSVEQVSAWADLYAKEGGHGLIVQMLRAYAKTLTAQRVEPAVDFAPDAHRLALELECLLLSCKDNAAVSRWWDSAHEALAQHRELVAAMQQACSA